MVGKGMLKGQEALGSACRPMWPLVSELVFEPAAKCPELNWLRPSCDPPQDGYGRKVLLLLLLPLPLCTLPLAWDGRCPLEVGWWAQPTAVGACCRLPLPSVLLLRWLPSKLALVLAPLNEDSPGAPQLTGVPAFMWGPMAPTKPFPPLFSRLSRLAHPLATDAAGVCVGAGGCMGVGSGRSPPAGWGCEGSAAWLH